MHRNIYLFSASNLRLRRLFFVILLETETSVLKLDFRSEKKKRSCLTLLCHFYHFDTFIFKITLQYKWFLNSSENQNFCHAPFLCLSCKKCFTPYEKIVTKGTCPVNMEDKKSQMYLTRLYHCVPSEICVPQGVSCINLPVP